MFFSALFEAQRNISSSGWVGCDDLLKLFVYQSGSGAPTGNSAFLGEYYLDTSNNNWFRSVSVGSGASDWVAAGISSLSAFPAVTSLDGTEIVHVVQGGVDKYATVRQLSGVNSNYFFHGFAGKQRNLDPKFYDLTGNGNHASFGANLSVANAWAYPGYIASVNPVTNLTDSVIRLPNLNFDYAGGQKLILWWLGIVSTPASNESMLGDGINGTYHGFRVRANTTGKFQLALYDSVQSAGLFGSASTGVPFDGTLHSFAFMLDGSAKQYGMWVDEVYESTFNSAYSTYNAGTSVDTTNANTVQIGTAGPAASVTTDGLPVLTSAIAILKLSATEPTPSVATLTSIFQQQRANPDKLILESAF